MTDAAGRAVRPLLARQAAATASRIAILPAANRMGARGARPNKGPSAHRKVCVSSRDCVLSQNGLSQNGYG
eukprot:1924115-Prorocentrum_lima.AAC.1